MSWLSDAWHGATSFVTAPVNAITGLVGDITSGQNVFDSVKNQSTKLVSPMLVDATLALDIKPVDSILKASSPFTLGLGNDIRTLGSDSRTLNSGGSLSSSESTNFLKTFGKDAAVSAAIIGTGDLIGAESASAQVAAGLAGGSVTKSLLTGDVKGAVYGAEGLASQGGYFGDYTGLADNVAQAFAPDSPSGPGKGSSRVTSSGYSSSQSGYGGSGNSPIAAIALIGLGTFLYLRMRKKS